ncbi:MAG: helicase-related protein [Gammaproteobacteria bacterium]|nr:helicase-related protein [Gammaproteobacteria bacterium]
MAAYFQREGVQAAAVHGRSELSRGEALDQLAHGTLEVIFSVDLFSEGVDLPAIDTILMLRPTESKILFLQQLGRGLRKAEGKDRLVVLDFIGNHHAFLHKARRHLAEPGPTDRDRGPVRPARWRATWLLLPDGCFINYDLGIDRLPQGAGLVRPRERLPSPQGRSSPADPRSRSSTAPARASRRCAGSTAAAFTLVAEQGDLDELELQACAAAGSSSRSSQTSAMSSKCNKMVLPGSLPGAGRPGSIRRRWTTLARHSRASPGAPAQVCLPTCPSACAADPAVASADLADVLARATPWRPGLGETRSGPSTSPSSRWTATGSDARLRRRQTSAVAALTGLVQELIDYRLARGRRTWAEASGESSSAYGKGRRLRTTAGGDRVFPRTPPDRLRQLSESGRTDADESRPLGSRHRNPRSGTSLHRPWRVDTPWRVASIPSATGD